MKPDQHRPSPLRFALRRLARHKGSFGLALFWSVLFVLVPLQVPVITRAVIDSLRGKHAHLYGFELDEKKRHRNVRIAALALVAVAARRGHRNQGQRSDSHVAVALLLIQLESVKVRVLAAQTVNHRPGDDRYLQRHKHEQHGPEQRQPERTLVPRQPPQRESKRRRTVLVRLHSFLKNALTFAASSSPVVMDEITGMFESFWTYSRMASGEDVNLPDTAITRYPFCSR